MRALKRIKNAPKELARLKKTLGLDGLMDTEMTELVTGGCYTHDYAPSHSCMQTVGGMFPKTSNI